jgi:hypothetical protein
MVMVAAWALAKANGARAAKAIVLSLNFMGCVSIVNGLGTAVMIGL